MTWPTKKLGEVCEANPKLRNDLSPSLEVGFLTMADVSEDAEIINIQKRKLSEVRKGFTNFINGDILVAKITPCFENGKGAFVDGMPSSIGFGSTEFHVLRADKNLLLNKYLYYFVNNKSFRTQNATFMTGSAGQRRVSTDFLKKIKIPLPPLATQKQIVERLDKIAEAQKLNDELIKKTNELFQSLLHKELNPAGKNWEVKKLGDIIKPQYGYTTSAKDSGNYRFIRITDIGDDGELRDSDKKYVTLNQNEAGSYQLRNGDLLLARTGATFGKILHFEKTEPAIFASFLIRLNPDASIDPFYIWLFSRSQNYWRQAKTLMTGSGQPQFNANKLKQIKIPVPPIKQQKQIVAKLSAVQEYKIQLLAQKSKLKELFDSTLSKSFRYS